MRLKRQLLEAYMSSAENLSLIHPLAYLGTISSRRLLKRNFCRGACVCVRVCEKV
jgi:hypothetical protein